MSRAKTSSRSVLSGALICLQGALLAVGMSVFGMFALADEALADEVLAGQAWQQPSSGLQAAGMEAESLSPQATNYNLWVGGVQVTSDNASNITGDRITGGTVSFDAGTNTLTLNNATISSTAANPATFTFGNANGAVKAVFALDPAKAAPKPTQAPSAAPAPQGPVEIVDLPAVKIAKLKAGKKSATVTWKKRLEEGQEEDPGHRGAVQHGQFQDRRRHEVRQEDQEVAEDKETQDQEEVQDAHPCLQERRRRQARLQVEGEGRQGEVTIATMRPFGLQHMDAFGRIALFRSGPS